MTVEELIQLLSNLDSKGDFGVYVKKAEGIILPIQKAYLEVCPSCSEHNLVIIE